MRPLSRRDPRVKDVSPARRHPHEQEGQGIASEGDSRCLLDQDDPPLMINIFTVSTSQRAFHNVLHDQEDNALYEVLQVRNLF